MRSYAITIIKKSLFKDFGLNFQKPSFSFGNHCANN